MKTYIEQPVEVEVKYLYVYPGDRLEAEDIEFDSKGFECLEEIKEVYPTLFTKIQSSNSKQEFCLCIDVDTGYIVNWPLNVSANFRSVKIVDEGTYVLRDDNDKEIHTHEYCYVPNCLQIEDNGYGDYFEFTVNKDGYINNWKFTQEDINEILDVEGY